MPGRLSLARHYFCVSQSVSRARSPSWTGLATMFGGLLPFFYRGGVQSEEQVLRLIISRSTVPHDAALTSPAYCPLSGLRRINLTRLTLSAAVPFTVSASPHPVSASANRQPCLSARLAYIWRDQETS